VHEYIDLRGTKIGYFVQENRENKKDNGGKNPQADSFKILKIN
jgi:hypothetical protein